MAKKLSSLKASKDKNGKRIKCLIIEDYMTGLLTKCYDQSKFSDILEKTDAMFVTKVFVPSQEEKEDIYKLLDDSKNMMDEKLSVDINEEIMVVSLMSKLTDVEIDVEDKDEIKEIVENPTELFEMIHSELSYLLLSIMESYVENYKSLNANPQVSKVLIDKINAEQEIVVDEIELKRQALLKELEELK